MDIGWFFRRYRYCLFSGNFGHIQWFVVVWIGNFWLEFSPVFSSWWFCVGHEIRCGLVVITGFYNTDYAFENRKQNEKFHKLAMQIAKASKCDDFFYVLTCIDLSDQKLSYVFQRIQEKNRNWTSLHAAFIALHNGKISCATYVYRRAYYAFPPFFR